jgi:hypothetical protein
LWQCVSSIRTDALVELATRPYARIFKLSRRIEWTKKSGAIQDAAFPRQAAWLT